MAVPSTSRFPVLTLPLFLAAVPAVGQELVLPPSHAAVPGSDWTQVPFGRSTPMRVQMAYDASLFSGPFTFSFLDFRVDEGATTAGKTWDLEIFASSLGGSITSLQSTFAANRGADETVVFDRAIFSLPVSGNAASPNPFDVTIPLDHPFTFDPATGGSLVLEIVIHGQPPGAFPLDSAFLCESVQEGFGPSGCGPVGGPVLKADSVTTQVTWGGNVTLRIFDAVPGNPVWLLYGLQESGPWMGIDLPFELGPLGAAGCHLSIAPIVTLADQADAAGAAYFSFFLPSQLEYLGDWIRFQGLALDDSANALGLVASQGHRVQVCGWEPIGRVFSSGITDPVGLREIGFAPVVRLR